MITSPTSPRRARPAVVLLSLLAPVLATLTSLGAADAARPTCAGLKATIVGTEGADTIRGTAHRDVIVARGGDDRIAAGAGNDVVCGGGGNDRIDAGAGDDAVRGEGGSDRVDGGAGRDRIVGGAGRDLCAGERRSGCEGKLRRRLPALPALPVLPTGQPVATDPCQPVASCQQGAYPTRWVVDVKGREVRTGPDSKLTVDWEASVVLVRVGDPRYQWNWQQESGSGSYHRTGTTSGGLCTVEASGALVDFRSDLSLVPTQGAYFFDIDAGGPGTSTLTCVGSGTSTIEDEESLWAATGAGPVLEPWDLSGSTANGSMHQDGDYVDRDASWVITPR
jgi:hypothetical protein